MGIYGREQYEADLEAVDRAEGCLSAAILGDPYVGRLDQHIEALHEVMDYFQGPDATTVGRLFVTLIEGQPLGGMASLNATATFERVRRKLKGKLFGTRLMLQDRDAARKVKAGSPKVKNTVVLRHIRRGEI